MLPFPGSDLTHGYREDSYFDFETLEGILLYTCLKELSKGLQMQHKNSQLHGRSLLHFFN